MSEQTVRERIWHEVRDAYHAGWDACEVPSKWERYKDNDVGVHTDRIIAIVREALLSDEAVEMGAKSLADSSADWYMAPEWRWDNLGRVAREPHRQQARALLEALLSIDAALGPDT